jgi:hypothetical protein
MSAPIIPTAVRPGLPQASVDFAEPRGVGDPASAVRIVKADGLRGSLGLFEVTINGETELLTRDELDQRYLRPGSGAHRFGAPPETPADPAAPQLPASDAGVVMAKRNVANATLLATRTAGQLHELAKWPQKAHAAWNDLTQLERIAVFESMQKRYGETFARQFLQFTKSGARDDGAFYGPQLAEQTPQRFADRGFKLAQRDSELDWWVHPSGYSITVDREREVSKSSPAVVPPEAGFDATEDLETPPETVDPAPADFPVMDREPIDWSGEG